MDYTEPTDGDWSVAEPMGEHGKAEKPNNIMEKTFAYALRMVSFSKMLRDAGCYDMARQVFNSGTSVGAHVSEAQQAKSRADFINKMKGAAQEGIENKYWMRLCKASELLPYEHGLVEEISEINAILGSIISNTIANDPRRQK